MSQSALLLGIDVGTTQTKVGAFYLDGRPAVIAAHDYALAFEAGTGAAEQDPEDWWRATQQALHEILADLDPHDLIAVAVGGQGPTVVAIDEDLNPVCPALTWMDRRSSHEVAALSTQLGRSLPAHAFLPKVMWLKNQRTASYHSARWFCQSWDFVAARLCGEVVASTSPAIAPWDNAQLTASELDRTKIPTSQIMGAPLGSITAAASAQTGLPEGLAVIGGISDYYGSVIGSNTLQPGVACDNGGTSQSLNVCWDAALDVQGAFCLPSFEAGRWYAGGPASTSGKAFDWWRHTVLGVENDDETLLQAAAEVRPGSENLIFLPYLAGERAPLWDPTARGVFFGLSLSHDRAHLTRAVMEAVAYILCHIIERVEAAGGRVQEIHACGGQAQSDLWNSIKSDATGRSVVVPEVVDAAMLGSAIIAGVGVGAFADFADGAARMVRPRARIDPDAARHEKYQLLFSIYRDLYPALQPLFQRLEKVAAQ